MDNGQGQQEDQGWNQHGLQSAAAYRMSDIITVLSGLREEVDVLEGEIQKVEAELLEDQDNKVLNRKYARLAEEKKNKENRRERLELQLTNLPEALYPPAQPGHSLLPSHPELNIHGQAAQQYHYITGAKRDREDGQPDYHHPNPALQGYAHGAADIAHEVAQQQAAAPPRGQGRGGKGGQKFCKRCKERITHGHQQKCRFCRQCYEDSKSLVLRSECPHDHNNAATSAETPPPPMQPDMLAARAATLQQGAQPVSSLAATGMQQHQQMHLSQHQLSQLHPGTLQAQQAAHQAHLAAQQQQLQMHHQSRLPPDDRALHHAQVQALHEPKYSVPHEHVMHEPKYAVPHEERLAPQPHKFEAEAHKYEADSNYEDQPSQPVDHSQQDQELQQ